MKGYALCLLLLLGAACSRVGEKPAVVAGADGGEPAVAVIPTDAEIADFVSAWQDPEDASKSIRFEVGFGGARLMPQIMEEFRERGKIPFVIAVDFYQMVEEPLVRVRREVGIYSIMDGQAEIAVLDADGKIVDRVRRDLALLCPS